MPATVLIVCTGNLHRSPIAEHIFRAALTDTGIRDVTIRSAGTVARGGDPMPAETREVLAGRGIDGAAFRTTYLDDSAVADVDLLIGAAREHRSAAVTLRPALLNRAFTLFELGRICQDLDGSDLVAGSADERVRELSRVAAARRTHSLPADPAADDLPDPIGQPMSAFVQCAAAVEQAMAPVVRLLAPPRDQMA